MLTSHFQYVLYCGQFTSYMSQIITNTEDIIFNHPKTSHMSPNIGYIFAAAAQNLNVEFDYLVKTSLNSNVFINLIRWVNTICFSSF